MVLNWMLLECLILTAMVCSKLTELELQDKNNIDNHFLQNPAIQMANVTQCDCGWRNSQNRLQIVGGDETGVNEFPAMAALIDLDSQDLRCGGHIISDRYILTAGHCVYLKAATSLMVLVGDHNISAGTDTDYSALYYVSAYEINPYYDHNNLVNDIAIVQTSTKIIFSNYVAPICLPFKYSSYDFSNQAATILGWGQTSFTGPLSGVLLKALLGVLTNTQCTSMQGQNVLAGQICTYAYGRDACQYDSGGPVLWTDTAIARMYLIGIISNGIGCGGASPGVNTRVTSYLNWILDRTSDASYCYM